MDVRADGLRELCHVPFACGAVADNKNTDSQKAIRVV